MKKRTYMWLGVLLAALFLVSTVLTGCARSAESVAPAPNAAVGPIAASSVATAATSSPSGGAPQEGIKVHGHWTIEVKNPDGSLAECREFDNAIAAYGISELPRVLGRVDSVGGWALILNAVNSTDNAFLNAGGQPDLGAIMEATYQNSSNPNIFKNLTPAVPNSGMNAGKLVLSGTATAQRNGKIEVVTSAFAALPSTSPPSSTYLISDIMGTFTGTTLANAVTVSNGQQIAVTVVISFS